MAEHVTVDERLLTTLYGACSSMAERFPVEEDVVGSKPIRHPFRRSRSKKVWVFRF